MIFVLPKYIVVLLSLRVFKVAFLVFNSLLENLFPVAFSSNWHLED